MATLISQIITDAFFNDNIVPLNGTPTTAEQTRALRLLQQIVDEWVTSCAGELLNDWRIPGDTATAPVTGQQRDPRDPYGDNAIATVYPYPPINHRLVTKITSAQTVYMPQYPNDGSIIDLADAGSSSVNLTLDANGRKIESAATVVLDPSAVGERRWFFRADLQNWQRMTTLTNDSVGVSPFPSKYDALLAAETTIRLLAGLGKSPSESTLGIRDRGLTKFKAQYKQYTPTVQTYDIENIQSYRVDYGNLGNQGSFTNG